MNWVVLRYSYWNRWDVFEQISITLDSRKNINYFKATLLNINTQHPVFERRVLVVYWSSNYYEIFIINLVFYSGY